MDLATGFHLHHNYCNVFISQFFSFHQSWEEFGESRPDTSMSWRRVTCSWGCRAYTFQLHVEKFLSWIKDRRVWGRYRVVNCRWVWNHARTVWARWNLTLSHTMTYDTPSAGYKDSCITWSNTRSASHHTIFRYSCTHGDVDCGSVKSWQDWQCNHKGKSETWSGKVVHGTMDTVSEYSFTSTDNVVQLVFLKL